MPPDDDKIVLRVHCIERHRLLDDNRQERKDNFAKDIKTNKDKIECHAGKIAKKADKDDLELKANEGEFVDLKAWVSKIDKRFWALIILCLGSFASAMATLLILLLKSGAGG